MTEATTDILDIAVVGSGPSGMIAALLLHEKGLRTALIGPDAKADTRTTALLDASVSILNEIGIWPDVMPHAAALRNMRLIDDTGRLIRAPETMFESVEIGLEAFGYNVLNNDLNAVLKSALAASDITRVKTFASEIRPEADCVEIKIEDRAAPLRARLVVASDGRESRVRDAAGIAVRRWRYPQAALVANLSHQLPHHDTSTEFHTPHGPFTLVPLQGERSSLVWVGEPSKIASLEALDDAAFAEAVERQARSFLGRMKLESGRQVFPLSGMKARTVAANRIALVGETAHVFPPIGAQGLNLSLRDVAALGQTCAHAASLGQDIGADAALDRYAKMRRGDIDTRIFGVDALNRTLLADFLPAQIARSLGLYLAGRVSPLRQLLMREGVAPSFRT